MTPRIPRYLSPIQHRIFWFVALSPAGVTKGAIFDHLYGDDPDGGPFDGCLYAHLTYLNQKLAAFGLKVAKRMKRVPTIPFNLRRLDNGNIWLPLARYLDGGGAGG